MPLTFNTIHQTDCVKALNKVTPGTIDLAFADPPTLDGLVTTSGLSSGISTMLTQAATVIAVIVVGALAFTLVMRLLGKAGRAVGR